MSTDSIPKLNIQGNCSTIPAMARTVELPPWDKRMVGKRVVIARVATNNMQGNMMAKAIGTAGSNLTNWEKGRHLFPADRAARFCIVTGVDYNYIYGGDMGRLADDVKERLLRAEADLASGKPKRKRSRRA
jgi:hypothetical protein